MSLPVTSKEDILGIASLNHLLNETVEAWVAENQTDNKVQFLQPEQILVLVLHISFLAVGFKHVKDRDNEDTPRLPIDWNRSEPYVFQYLHSQSQFHFQLKALSLNKRLIIHASAEEIHDFFTLDVMTDELISDQLNFPFDLSSESAKTLELSQLFISHSKLTKFITDFRQRILQKLIPGLHKEGYQEISSAGSSAPGSPHLQARENRRPVSEFPKTSNLPQEDREANSSKNSNPPSFLDPEISFPVDSRSSIYDSQIPAGGSFNTNYPNPDSSFRGSNPMAYGDSDINPLGGVGGGLPRLGGGSALDPFGMNSSSQGGMILGLDHPMFNPRPGFSSNRDPRHLPPGAAPPGARFDPINPMNPGRSLHRPPQRGPQFPFSGEPDNDEAPPPGYNDMYM